MKTSLSLICMVPAMCFATAGQAQNNNNNNNNPPYKVNNNNNGNNNGNNDKNTKAPFGGAIGVLIAAGAALSMKQANDKRKAKNGPDA